MIWVSRRNRILTQIIHYLRTQTAVYDCRVGVLTMYINYFFNSKIITAIDFLCSCKFCRYYNNAVNTRYKRHHRPF